MTDPRSAPLMLAAGFAIWAACFVALYAVNAIGCELGWHGRTAGPLSMLRLILLSIWLGHLAVFAPLLAALRRRTEPPDRWQRVVLGCTLAAGAATLWTGLPVLTASACI
jgi:hypothetical protein